MKLLLLIPLFLIACVSSPAPNTAPNTCATEQEQSCKESQLILDEDYEYLWGLGLPEKMGLMIATPSKCGTEAFERRKELRDFAQHMKDPSEHYIKRGIHSAEEFENLFKKEGEEFIKKCENCPLADWKGMYRIKGTYNSIKSCIEDLKQDSINKINIANAREKSASEINALIENGNAETNLVLDKCNEHEKTFKGELQICSQLRASIKQLKDSTDLAAIATLLKANELEKCISVCNSIKVGTSFEENFNNLCKKQLVEKVRKLPKNKINTIALAKLYYEGYEEIAAKIFHISSSGDIAAAETIGYNRNISVQISGSIGCDFKNSEYIVGYAKYLGMQSKTVLGTIPHYQLLWCGNLE